MSETSKIRSQEHAETLSGVRKWPLDSTEEFLPLRRKVSDACSVPQQVNGGGKKKAHRPLTGNLSFYLWSRIILMAEDPDNITSPQQRANLFHWSKSRASLKSEQEFLGKSLDVQIRRVLGEIGMIYEI